MEQQRALMVDSRGRPDVESLLALGSAIAWGALALSVLGLIEHSRARRLRHQVSDRLLGQVFPSGRLE